MILSRAELLTDRLLLALWKSAVQTEGRVGALFWHWVPANEARSGYAKQAALIEDSFADTTTLAVTTREFSQNSCVSQQSYFGRNLYCGPSLIFRVELTFQ